MVKIFKKRDPTKGTEALSDLPGKKLHLGCGDVKLPGYINIDSSMACEPDLHVDFRDLGSHFEPETVKVVLMIHSIAYLRLWEARDLFLTVYRLLVNGGMLIIESPDVVNCAKIILENPNSLKEYIEGIRGFYAFDPTMIKDKIEYVPYAFGWSSWHLKLELENIGFREVEVKEPQTHVKWRDFRIEATK